MFFGNKCGCGYTIPSAPAFKLPCDQCNSTGLVSAYKEGEPPRKLKEWAVFLCTCENAAQRSETYWVDGQPKKHKKYDFKASSEGWKI